MRDATSDDRRTNAYPFLAGGGEMGERIRNFDWSKTPLGAIDTWPQQLRSTLSICLNSNFPIGIYWGPELVMLYNDEWSSVAGKHHPWALGQPARQTWQEVWHIVQPLLEQVVSTGQSKRSREQLLPRHRQGYTDERYFDYTFSPIRGDSGQVEGVFNAVLETTSRVIDEHRSAATDNATDYELVRQRADSLAEIDKAKTVFFSNISHEFRTPLTLMLSPIEDLLNETSGRLPADAVRSLELAHRNGMRLLRLVNTLLDFARIEAGRLPIEPTSTHLARYTHDLASVFSSIVEHAGLQLRIDCDHEIGPVPIDRDMWEKIVLNLLSNAFKYTNEGRIDVELLKIDNSIQLRVSDTGLGIPAEDLPRIFERFHRVSDARGRTHEGSGIGLSLVHELVKLHGGTVEVTSQLGKGSCFTVTIPVRTIDAQCDSAFHDQPYPSDGATSNSPLLAAYHATVPRLKPLELAGALFSDERHDASSTDKENLLAVRARVLIADANDDMRVYMMRMLSQHYEVRGVADGQAALDEISHWHPDLVLTDVMMPNLDGFGLLKALRSNPTTANLPVIMLSARAGEECRVEGLQAGVDDYLVKPFSARELLARVGSHLQLQHQRRQTEHKLQRNAERLRLLWEAAAVLLTTDEPDVMLRQIFDKIKSNFRLDGYFNFVIDEAKTGLRLLSCAGIPAEVAASIERIGFGQAVCGCVAKRCEPIVATYVQESNHEMVQLIRTLGIRAYACFPLVESGHLLGTLSFASSQRDTFDGDELDFFQTICQYVTAAYIKMRLISELRQAHQRKDEFLATLAHELRNPMAPIRNGVQLLKMVGNHNCDSVDSVLGMMERQLQQLVHLVDDLLDISRISRGKIELRKERIALSTAIEQAIETSRPLIEGARHHLRMEQPEATIWVDADKTRLAQVFSNLLNNAAKYTEPGGEIAMSVRTDQEWVAVEVRDNGIGIPQHKLPHVFEMFTQVDKDLNRSQGGLGIGLAIVRQLVEMHGGRVELFSEGHGRGSRFTVHLPIAEPVVDAKPATLGSTMHSSSHRILVVDDNQDAANSLALMLRLLGNDTRTAHDGSAALQLAEVFQPELIVLDIGMPGMNGYEVAQAIRRSPWGQNMTLAALTGWGQEEDRRKSQAAGFNTHLVKPIEPKVLRSLIASLN